MVPDIGKVPFLVDATEGGIHTAQDAGQQREVFLLLRLSGGGIVLPKYYEVRWHLFRCQTF